MGAPWYGVYLWVTLGNGFRYGERYLYLSCVASLAGFGYVVSTSPYWIANTEMAVGLALTLLIIPGYSGVLIRRLNEALQRADAASRAKSDFLSCMSHEIRTPLNGILGMTDLLRLRPLASEDKECVDTIHASGQALARQINDILDLSKIEAGELSLETIEFDLYALIGATLRIFQPQVNAKQLQLREDLDPKTPYLLSGDPHKLRQVIINLVGNAIKFTDQGFISVRVHPREFTPGGVRLRFEVSDTGVGIPPERQHAIFEPFTQADNSVTRNYGGTGLGTTICKNIVELMGGEIGLQSTPGVGSTFWFDIPFETAETAGVDSQAWTGECRVLYLPPAGTRDGLGAELRSWGIRFDTAAGLEQAIDRVRAAGRTSPYHALLLDNPPPGSELDALLSGEPDDGGPGTTTVILITSGPFLPGIDPGRQDRLFVLDHMTDKRILLNALHASYSRQSTEEDIIHIAGHQVRARTGASPLALLVVDDNATNRIVLQRMLEKLGHRCTTLAGGEAALEELEHRAYDAVVIDRNMPGLGGLETWQAYCLAHGGHPPVPFIILTADATEECRDMCRAAGIELFMTKPVSLARLQETLAAIDKQEHAGDPAPVAPLVAAEPARGAAQPVLDETEFGNLVSLAAGNPDFLGELIGNFESDAAHDIRGLETAVANHDWPSFRDYAHALKGGALYLGLSRLARLSLEAQSIDQDAFERDGIARVRGIQQAVDEALRALHRKGDTLRATG